MRHFAGELGARATHLQKASSSLVLVLDGRRAHQLNGFVGSFRDLTYEGVSRMPQASSRKALAVWLDEVLHQTNRVLQGTCHCIDGKLLPKRAQTEMAILAPFVSRGLNAARLTTF